MKFHYTKKKSNPCTLRLSDDFSTLIWEYDNQLLSSKIMKRFVSI